MRQTELHLADQDRALIESYRAKGLRHAREVNRAHILSALDRGIPEAQIMEVLGVGRTAIWRTRSAYLEGGAKYALCDVCRTEQCSSARWMLGSHAATESGAAFGGRSLDRMWI